MKWGVQVVKPTTYNTESTSIMLQFPNGRYLFNCGEGTQRLSFENKTRISKLTAVFLTRVDWENMGGLPGMLLTLADTGARNMTVCGGPNLTHAMAATRHFILRNDMGVGVKELRDGDATAAFTDENVKVTPVHIYPDGYTANEQEKGPDSSKAAVIRKQLMQRAFGIQIESEPQQNSGRKRREPQPQQKKKGYYGQQCKEAALEELLQKLEQQGEDTAKKRTRSFDHDSKQLNNSEMMLPPTVPTPVALCYIVEGPEVPGKFDVNAAKALGLKPGPVFSRLVKGETITMPDGTTISPEQCVGPTRPGGIVLIIDCPSVAYINSLTSSMQFTPFFEDKEKQQRLRLIVHSLGAGVAQDLRYKAWAARFPSNVYHMLSAPEFIADNYPFQRHLRIHSSMIAVDPHTYIQPQATSQAELQLGSFIESKNLILPSSMATFDIEPKPKLDESAVTPLLTPQEMRAKIQPSYDSSVTVQPPANDDDLVVCPIGTGSSVPSTYRNVSGNIVSVKGYGGMILDCGESTASLLKRFLGYPQRNHNNTRIQQNYVEFMQSLRLLYVSHMHADHHLGAIQLLHDWSQQTAHMNPQPRLTILAPARFWSWLEDYSGVQNIGLHRLDFINCSDIRFADPSFEQAGKSNMANWFRAERALNKLKADLGLSDVSTCSVIHCPWAYGVSLTHSSGWKLVYSGDTRPCGNLVALGRAGDKPPTILLHEATLPDDLRQDAVAKRHSTVSEAVAMALGMGAENLLLTHFSQRCLTLPRWYHANIAQVKVSHYGILAVNNSLAAGGNQTMDSKMDEFADMDSKAADEAELSESSDFGDTKGIMRNLKVASAFDLSAYGPSDIVRYKTNVAKLKRAMFEEMKLFIAEEDSEKSEEIPANTKKSSAKASKKGAQRAKAK
ncbi:hypothetical protein H4R22_002565 [Coemansia sp. RSA 1290]|nr:hypothetical protein H4R22_002565 [Coemansia sp. RSA 1290]